MLVGDPGEGPTHLWGVQRKVVREGFWEEGRWKMRCKRKERTGRVGGCWRVVGALCEPTELHLMRGHSGPWGRGQEERERWRGLRCHSAGVWASLGLLTPSPEARKWLASLNRWMPSAARHSERGGGFQTPVRVPSWFPMLPPSTNTLSGSSCKDVSPMVLSLSAMRENSKQLLVGCYIPFKDCSSAHNRL